MSAPSILSDAQRKWVAEFTGIDPGPHPAETQPPPAGSQPGGMQPPGAGAQASGAQSPPAGPKPGAAQPPPATPAPSPVASLDAQIATALKAGDWAAAAVALNAFNQSDLKGRLKNRNKAEMGKLHDAAVSSPKLGPQSQIALMTVTEPDGLKIDRGVPLPKKEFSPGGKIKIEISPVLKVTCYAVLSGGGGVDTKAASDAAAGAAKQWFAGTAEPELASGSFMQNLKLGKSGTAYAVTSETDTPLGKLSFKAILVGLDLGVTKGGSGTAGVDIAKVEIELTGKVIHLADQQVGDVKLTHLAIEAGGKAEMGPDWKSIITRWAVETAGKELAASAGEKTAEIAVAAISIEGALIVGGVAAVAGMVYSLVMAWGVGDLGQGYKPGLDSAKAGFKAGMANAAAPTDPYGKVGYDAGRKNYLALFDETKKKNPNATDDQIKAAIAAKADDALKQIAPALDRAVRTGLWDGFLAQHTTMLISSDARWAFVACFGDFPKDSDPEWKKYVAAHPTASKF